jgi:hypothetical protein
MFVECGNEVRVARIDMARKLLVAADICAIQRHGIREWSNGVFHLHFGMEQRANAKD